MPWIIGSWPQRRERSTCSTPYGRTRHLWPASSSLRAASTGQPDICLRARRRVYHQVPPKVEYSLTEFGASLNAALGPLGVWGDANTERIEAIPRRCPAR
ncbi:winged helix-turn-helix transcriptional regulator [Promicromonospora aerolata]|uniref:Winged helix-turn-helix transcriptional regulator n=1 Tax=Promicromonospora aerolata TaxID=195749 RepID=A0ABW4VF09_9MICO